MEYFSKLRGTYQSPLEFLCKLTENPKYEPCGPLNITALEGSRLNPWLGPMHDNNRSIPVNMVLEPR